MSITKCFFTAGLGRDKYAISSFDSALLDADIGNYNLVRVSSILPPVCKKSSHVDVPYGALLHTAYATMTIAGSEMIAAAVAAAVPINNNECGVIMEYADRINKINAIKIAEDLAREAMAKRNRKIKEIISIGVEAVGEDGLYTTTFAGIALF